MSNYSRDIYLSLKHIWYVNPIMLLAKSRNIERPNRTRFSNNRDAWIEENGISRQKCCEVLIGMIRMMLNRHDRCMTSSKYEPRRWDDANQTFKQVRGAYEYQF
jgi:hypothetical protein